MSQYTGRQTTQVKKNVLVLVLEWPKNEGQKCPVLQQMRVRVNTVSESICVCVCVFVCLKGAETGQNLFCFSLSMW